MSCAKSSRRVALKRPWAALCVPARRSSTPAYTTACAHGSLQQLKTGGTRVTCVKVLPKRSRLREPEAQAPTKRKRRRRRLLLVWRQCLSWNLMSVVTRMMMMTDGWDDDFYDGVFAFGWCSVFSHGGFWSDWVLGPGISFFLLFHDVLDYDYGSYTVCVVSWEFSTRFPPNTLGYPLAFSSSTDLSVSKITFVLLLLLFSL